jgi:hypothetical protein
LIIGSIQSHSPTARVVETPAITPSGTVNEPPPKKAKPAAAKSKAAKPPVKQAPARPEGTNMVQQTLAESEPWFQAATEVAVRLQASSEKQAEGARVFRLILGTQGEARWAGQGGWGDQWWPALWHSGVCKGKQDGGQHYAPGAAVLAFTDAQDLLCIAMTHLVQGQPAGTFTVSEGTYKGLEFRHAAAQKPPKRARRAGAGTRK